MTLKKKVVVSSLAVSLALGNLAGLPLSSKGLAEKLGLGVAHANPVEDSGIVDIIADVHSRLTEEELASIRAARDKLVSLNESDLQDVNAIWTKISTKIADSKEYDLLEKDHLIGLIKEISFVYDGDATSLYNAITDSDNRAAMAQLAALGGFPGSGNDFKLADAVAFKEAVLAKSNAYFAANKTAAIEAFVSGKASTFAKTALENILTDVLSNKGLKISQLLTNLGITSKDIVADYTALNAKIDTADNAAQMALALGYARSQAEFKIAATGSWNSVTPTLSFWGTAIPNSVLTWSVEGENLKVDATNTITYSAPSAATATKSAKLTAKVLGTSKVLYTATQDLTFTYVNDNDKSDNGSSGGGHSGGGGGGGGVAPSNNVTAPDKAKAQDKLKEVASGLAELLKATSGNGLKKAQEAIENAIRETATTDLSNVVKVEGDVAKPTLDLNKLTGAFQTVNEIAKYGNDQLKAAAPDAKPAKVIATLNLGSVSAKTAQFPLAKDLITKAKENGIEAFAVKVNGVSLTVDLDQLSGDTNVTVIRNDKSAASGATTLAVASDVYDFTFESNGSKLENFSKPVQVRIPVSVSSVDTELLVFAKLDGGSLVFKGGSLDSSGTVFVANSKSFSKYAIVENKVSFNDIADVKDWAGRQIAVAASKGILEGRGEAQFVPNAKVTRAEFAKMLVKTFGLEDAAATESFSDVSDADWYKPYVASAVKVGLVQGREADKFAPNAFITRAEMATMASRALTTVLEYKKAAGAEEALKSFADAAAIHDSLKDGVALSAGEGIVVGEDGGKFNPAADTTRAQAAVVISRLLNK